MALAPDQQSSYSAIIDSILKRSDLTTVTPKEIRAQLEQSLGYDISHQKKEVNGLIKERFYVYENQATSQPDSVPVTTNGSTTNGVVKSIEGTATPTPPPRQTLPSPPKRSADESDLSDLDDEPKAKKKKVKQASVDDDAAFAARLQQEENMRARPTRGGNTKKRVPNKNTAKKAKKKSAARVKNEDDSSNDSGSEEPKEKKGAFHKPYALSEPLAALVGESQLSRPQTVKKIWAYVRERNLQDPSDKRQIQCDDALRKVFKSERVHMFTMNKILSQNLYALDE